MSSKRSVVGKGMDALFSGVRKLESGERSPDSRVQIEESRLQSPDSRKIGLKEGDRSRGVGDEMGKPRRQGKMSREKSPDSRVQTLEARGWSIDTGALEAAVAEAQAYPKCSIWSPLVMAVLRYRQMTVLRYKMSAEAAELLEKAVTERYPELCKEIQTRIEDA